jgi:hypothetical protein
MVARIASKNEALYKNALPAGEVDGGLTIPMSRAISTIISSTLANIERALQQVFARGTASDASNICESFFHAIV